MKRHDDPDERLRELVIQALDHKDHKDGGRTPLSDDEMVALLTGTSDTASEKHGEKHGEEHGALVDRLLTDGDAARRMRALRSLDSWSEKTASVLKTSVLKTSVLKTSVLKTSTPTQGWIPRSGPGIRTWALAATVLLAIGVAVLRLGLLRPGLENPTGDSVDRGVAVQEVVYEPADAARVTAVPEVFRWTLPPSISDDVEVQMLLFDDHTELLWKSPWGRDGQVQPPTDLRSRLKSGGTFFWRLSIDDGLEKRLTFLAQFEIKP